MGMKLLISLIMQRFGDFQAIRRSFLPALRASSAAPPCAALHTSAAFSGKYGSNRKHKGSLSSKEQPRGWYKGSGSRKLGRHTRKGKFILEPWLVPEVIVPDLSGTELRPYVSKKTPKIDVPPPNFDALL